MTSANLANLEKIGKLKAEPGDQNEFDGLVQSARARLTDAHSEVLSNESRFDLGYNASHALAGYYLIQISETPCPHWARGRFRISHGWLHFDF